LVVDFDMPKMSGLDLHKILSRLGKEIPTVMITAYPSMIFVPAHFKLGHLLSAKPFDEATC